MDTRKGEGAAEAAVRGEPVTGVQEAQGVSRVHTGVRHLVILTVAIGVAACALVLARRGGLHAGVVTIGLWITTLAGWAGLSTVGSGVVDAALMQKQSRTSPLMQVLYTVIASVAALFVVAGVVAGAAFVFQP